MRTFCCTVDVVTRPLAKQKTYRFPKERQLLLELMAADQEARASELFTTNNPAVITRLEAEEAKRTEMMLKILAKVRSPSARNIGLDGSRAVWLLALHNPTHKQAGPVVYKKMRSLFYRAKDQVFYPGIPYLADRLAIVANGNDHQTRQRYGTQRWLTLTDSSQTTSGRFPIYDEKNLEARLRHYDLGLPRKCMHNQL
jgi:hypothetical protein